MISKLNDALFGPGTIIIIENFMIKKFTEMKLSRRSNQSPMFLTQSNR